MGTFHDADRMFRGVNYNKFTSAAVKAAMEKKIVAVTAKIEERKNRLQRLMLDNDLTDAALNDILVQYTRDRERGVEKMSYANSASPRAPRASDQTEERMVPAGVVMNLVTEKGLIESEKGEISRMQLILRNLRDLEWATSPTTGEAIERVAIHSLSDDDMLYLGF